MIGKKADKAPVEPTAFAEVDPEAGRDKQVVAEPAKSFDERTVTQSQVEATAEPDEA